MLFLKLLLFSVVSAIGLGDSVVVELSEGISSELMSLCHVIQSNKMLLFLASKQSSGILELLSKALVVLGEAGLYVLVHQVVLAETCSILN